MATTVKVEGLRELETALKELPKATARNVLKRVGLKALQPVAEMARNLAPVDDGHLRDSIGAGTRLTRRQSSLHRKDIRSGLNDKNFWEGFAGAGGLPQAHLREFGGDDAPPHPFMRPAWEANKAQVLETIKTDLGAAIEKAAKRLARKMARLAARG